MLSGYCYASCVYTDTRSPPCEAKPHSCCCSPVAQYPLNEFPTRSILVYLVSSSVVTHKIPAVHVLVCHLNSPRWWALSVQISLQNWFPGDHWSVLSCTGFLSPQCLSAVCIKNPILIASVVKKPFYFSLQNLNSFAGRFPALWAWSIQISLQNWYPWRPGLHLWCQVQASHHDTRKWQHI